MLIRLARVSITKDGARKREKEKEKGKKRKGEKDSAATHTENDRLSLEISRDNRCHVFAATRRRRDNVIFDKGGT